MTETTDVVLNQPQTLRKILEDNQEAIRDMLPKYATVERIIKMALVAASRQPKLYDCTKTSLIRAMMDSAELGLDFSGQLGQGYLIPYFNKDIKELEAMFMPGWRGLRDLALQSPDVLDIESRVVYEKDLFSVEYGIDQVLKHAPFPNKDRGKVRAAYMIARLKSGLVKFEVMWVDEIENARQCSKAPNSPAWMNFYSEQCRKTVMRRGLKQLPMTTETQEKIRKAVEREDDVFGLPDINNPQTGQEPVEGQASIRSPKGPTDSELRANVERAKKQAALREAKEAEEARIAAEKTSAEEGAPSSEFNADLGF